ncbi:MAG: diaminopimelate aminotransferase [Treponema sp. GWB1_62_6]|nr:MAG: diaminopimelate aminotransferase [Treponema sp. GWB1_62_6]OHE67454.1 MAG: diaminopimelate aminotransferase [Treponema sp. GWC1_61_84]OHE76754.1 MAG: diaminopimelate aminotransferase [Treponema sp. RIFOXYC1_FULL_61_9]HCM28396.1 diaminopimelate aminotransferase [Treponema sp.]
MIAKILEHIEKSVPTMVELETGLCRYPALSPESGGAGEFDKCEFLQAWLAERGFKNLERHDAPDARAKNGVRPNLVATIPGVSDAKRLWIMSHTDVVPPGDPSMWKSDPWTVVQKDGRLYGRGVEDNQQGLVASVAAALALLENGITPAHTVKLLFVADEEMGSEYGIQWVLANRKLFRADDMVVIPDGGDEKGETIEVAEKNLLWLRIATKGVQCHGSRPDLGANAHVAAAELAVRLHDELPMVFPEKDALFDPDYSTFEPTKSEANVPNVNTIPGDDAFCMDMRVLPRYPLAKVLAEIERIMAEVAAKRRVAMTHETLQRVESKPTSPDAPLVRFLSKAVKEVYGVTTRPIGIGGGTVGAFLRNEGIDSVVWGRLHESAHQPNEFTVIENIVGDAKVMAKLMMEKR